MAESLGETPASRYHLLRPLGSGGMGTVWLARDDLLDREVAVKELRVPDGLPERERAERVARVMREAEVTARIRHPGIVAVHDVLVHDGRPWIVMELLHGRDLSKEIATYGPVPPPLVADIGARVLEALSEAHSRGVQHRDVKPGNVFLTEGGRVVLTDFGIARPADQTALTEAGLLVGSPGFIAPERLSGDPGGPAADLWSLAATLYTAVEGVSPYRSSPQESNAEVIAATLTRDPRPPHLAGPLGPLLTWMLARDPAARPDAATTLDLLRRIAAGGAPEISPEIRPKTAPKIKEAPACRPGARRTRIMVMAAVAVVAVAATAVVVLDDGGEEAVARPRPVSPTFDRKVDLCRALTPDQVGRLLGATTPPKGRASDDGCQWTVTGAGLTLAAETDSDTPEPWSLTLESARTLMSGLRRQYGSAPRDGNWIWYEIGVDRKVPVIVSGARPAADVGDEAFTADITEPGGGAQASEVYFRLGDLVARLQYADLDAGSMADVRRRAVEAAELAAEGLRGLA
ncbi:serine/threonine-protein kinase [Sphaerimonospora thailandensis]|uniref:non-specific serine/threonine protein kinase n=1 Tax=Sphaerimonospora thailandensis TaxID=795644 RepID=A0A8J3VZI9_9ACTN|nr:serine/threonine-protein kinase [Sphaerimonospora thailandensis]GIH70145.1 hypothetical protein Mth01_23980 [Sphaerimonospora thailandensis]